jgi:Domain of unknown function (DUF1707)
MGEGRLTVEELEDRLRAAYAAPTVRELELLVSDVTVPATARARSGGLSVREGPGGDRWVVSIMSGHERKGRWRIAEQCTVLNVMGGSGSEARRSGDARRRPGDPDPSGVDHGRRRRQARPEADQEGGA